MGSLPYSLSRLSYLFLLGTLSPLQTITAPVLPCLPHSAEHSSQVAAGSIPFTLKRTSNVRTFFFLIFLMFI